MAITPKEKEEKQYELLVAEKRFTKIHDLMKLVVAELKEYNNEELKEAVEKQSLLIEKFLSNLLGLPEPKVNVEVNQDKVVLEIQELKTVAEKIIEGQLNLIKSIEREKICVSVPKRANNGVIIEVTTTIK